MGVIVALLSSNVILPNVLFELLAVFVCCSLHHVPRRGQQCSLLSVINVVESLSRVESVVHGLKLACWLPFPLFISGSTDMSVCSQLRFVETNEGCAVVVILLERNESGVASTPSTTYSTGKVSISVFTIYQTVA